MSDSGYTPVGNARLAWWTDGDDSGGGDPLVLVHAGVADARMWEPIVPALAAQRRVVRFDMRGFGGSRSGKGTFSPAADLAALLDALAIERAHVVGASFGGLVSLEFAAAYPGRVASLVLLAAALPDIEPSPGLLAFAEAEEAAIAVGKVEEAVEVNVRMWASHSTPDVQTLVADMQRDAFELQLREGAESDEPDPPVSARLAAIAVPATVAYGDRDVEDFEQVARRLHDELPDATLHEIANAGHLLALDQPEAVTQLILRHLERVAAA
ncbi:MAG: 3-oxoadipate enol-lactonase [Solirubrobacteraceae bacterium]|nr:3-oxoadipate enol-lactonase [Solirubrobacteraceae bacterium]